MTEEEYLKLSEEDLLKYEEAEKAFKEDAEVIYTYNMLLNLTLLITTFSILFGYLLLEFGVPLLFKNGQTLGKKVFGIAIMREDCVRVTPLFLIIRTVIGKFTIETMIPVYIIIMLYFNMVGLVGTAVIILLLFAEVFLMARTKTNLAIHDMISSTVAVDMQSQMIFDTREEMIAYKERIHAEAVAKKEY